MVLLVLMGLPTKEKTSFGMRQSLENNWIYLDERIIRANLGTNKIKKNQLQAELIKEARNFLVKDSNVILNSNNLTKKERLNIVAAAKLIPNVETRLVFFNCSLSDCIQQNQTYKEKELKKLYNSVVWPSYSEGWSSIKIITLSELSRD